MISDPAVMDLRAAFSAVVEIDGNPVTLLSAEGQPIGDPQPSKEPTPFGEISVKTALIRFPKEGVILGLKLGEISPENAVVLQPFFKNTGTRQIKLRSLRAIDTNASGNELKLATTADPWIVTPLDQSAGLGKAPCFPLDAFLAGGKPIREEGAFYRADGKGFFVGPVGEPIAYLSVLLGKTPEGRLNFSLESQMSGILVDPGETRLGQEAVVWFRPPREALPKWAAWVASTHHARTDKGALDGWCSWYHLTNQITGKHVLGIVDAVKKQPDRLRPQVIQIDDGYQDFDGVWDANAKFPEGLPSYAAKIAETGARPGLWMAMTMIGIKAPWLQEPANAQAVWGGKFTLASRYRPDQNGFIDPTNPQAKAHIAERIRHAVASGFTYLKLDFNNIGSGGWWEKKRTSFQIMRDHYTNMRAAAGETTYLMSCNPQPERSVVGLVDAFRTSHDAFRGGLRSAMDDVLRSYQLNGRWGAVDNDIYYLDADVKSVGLVSGGEGLLRTWISMMGLSSGAAFTSDPWQWPETQAHLRMTEIMQPPAKERAEVLDLGTALQWPRLASLVHRPWGDQGVVLLWNPATGNGASKSIDFQLAQIGLDPKKSHAVWSFWDDKFLGLAKGSWTTPPLASGACQHLVFTPIDETVDHPVLIGSNLHIYCGAAEVAKVETGTGRIAISLNDAGAREGDLFIWSLEPLRVTSQSGLDVGGVESAGEHVWKVSIKGRQSGKPQSLELAAK